MSTVKVLLAADVYLTCLTHALSTEKEEVMGLLIGEIDSSRVSHITSVMILRRSDKQKDRVEISPEQLARATTYAETLAGKLGQPMRVIGWYHSHPHITVCPSHVDVKTQGMYQMLDDGFVGIIISVFSQDNPTKPYQIQLTCFQSINQSPEGELPQYMKLEVPIYIVPVSNINNHCLEMLLDLPKILCEEEQEAYSMTTQFSSADLFAKLHNDAVYTKALVNIAEVVSAPLLQMLERRIAEQDIKIRKLNERKENLKERLKLQLESKAIKTKYRDARTTSDTDEEVRHVSESDTDGEVQPNTSKSDSIGKGRLTFEADTNDEPKPTTLGEGTSFCK